MMKPMEYPFSHEWHVAINRHNSGKMGTKDWKSWMYEAMTMASEVPRLAFLFGKERMGSLPSKHKQCSLSPVEIVSNNHLTCSLGVKCAACPELLSLNQMNRVTPEDIDTAKAWTCVAHIASEGGDHMREGYVTSVDDRMFWDRIYENMSADDFRICAAKGE